MIFKSIKWRLQIWYGLILVVVLAGFGFTAYQLERGRQLGRIDDELHRRVQILANALRRPPLRGPGQGPGQGRGPRGQPGRPPLDRFQPGQPPDDNQPPPDQFPGDGPPGQNPRPPLQFQLPPEAAGMFDASDPNNFYFIVRARDGKEIASSTNQPPGEFSKIENFFVKRFGDGSQSPETYAKPAPVAYSFGNYRNTIQTLPPGETILAGCSIAPELQELHLTALKLAGFGGIILFFGLAGGWWFVSRALRPVENISAAAVKISAGDLSQRINVAEAESELGKLASVLNSTFARLDSAFAQQQQFTSDAAHELRTPVAVILSQAQMTLNRERTAPEYRETVEACQRAAKRMRRLIESLLALARLDAGQEPMKRMNFDLAQTAQDCVALIRPLADERGVKILAELKPLEIPGDSERLAQVITNLLTNAIQYNVPDGEVRVKLESQGGVAVLTVSDTGAGIPAEDLPLVFERFYRADKSRSTGGNGLGLSICKAIVEAHGGTMEVTSEENVGTSVTVRLPV